MEEKSFRRRDIALALILGLVFIVMLIFSLMPKKRETGLTVRVTKAGREILAVPLEEDHAYLVRGDEVTEVALDYRLSEPEEESEEEINLILIRNRTVRVEEANCKNQVCVHTAPIAEDSHDLPIACLPHDLLVTVS